MSEPPNPPGYQQYLTPNLCNEIEAYLATTNHRPATPQEMQANHEIKSPSLEAQDAWTFKRLSGEAQHYIESLYGAATADAGSPIASVSQWMSLHGAATLVRLVTYLEEQRSQAIGLEASLNRRSIPKQVKGWPPKAGRG